MVTVIPEEGELSNIAKALLAVANHPYEVQTVSHPHKAFRVPEDLFARFQAGQKEAVEQTEAEPVQPVEPKRRGRPRKVVVEQEETREPDQEGEEL